jgi:Major Facilitator Superfamily
VTSPASRPAHNAYPAAQEKIEAHVWLISGVVILGMIMSILDTTIVNVALDTLSRDLHSPISQVQWVVTGYLLALAAVIPITGWAARRYGAKRVYLTSLVLFTAGSAAPGRDRARVRRLRARRASGNLGGSSARSRSRRLMQSSCQPPGMGRGLPNIPLL